MNYSYYLEKSSQLIYKLCVGKGTAKQRIRECEIELFLALSCSVPDDLESLRKKILDNLCKKDEIKIDGKIQMTRFQRTMIYMKNNTASKIINDIYLLNSKVKDRCRD